MIFAMLYINLTSSTIKTNLSQASIVYKLLYLSSMYPW